MNAAYARGDVTQQRLAQVDMTVSVPEPGTIAMSGLGLVGLAAMRHRKAK